MSVKSIRDIKEGAQISFRSKNPNDTTDWQGTLESIGTYRSIRSIMNPSSYHQAVKQNDPKVPASFEDLLYFQITIENAAEQPITQVFADEWIQAGTLNEISLGNSVTIQVQDPYNNVQNILSILANANYACKVIS